MSDCDSLSDVDVQSSDSDDGEAAAEAPPSPSPCATASSSPSPCAFASASPAREQTLMPILERVEAEARRMLSDPSVDLEQVTVRKLRKDLEEKLGVALSATAEQKQAVKDAILRAFDRSQARPDGATEPPDKPPEKPVSRVAAAPHPDEPKPKKRRKRRTKAEIEQAKVAATINSLIVQVERMHQQEHAPASSPKQRKRRSKEEIEQAKVKDTVESLIAKVERKHRQELAAQKKERERQRKQILKAQAEAAREEARVQDTVRSWLCGTRNGLIAKIERAHAQALAEDEKEVQSVVDDLVKQLERDEAQAAHDFEQVRMWLCGTRSGVIAQLERLHEQAEEVVHNLFYAKRSGLIARLEREARDAAEESFRESEVQSLLQRSGKAQGRDSLGVFTAPQSPAEGEGSSDSDGPTVRFWWAKLQCVKKAVLRQSHSLSSKKIGFVKKNRVVQVVAFAEVDDVHRVQLARTDGQPGGWLSITSTAGNTLLEQIDEGRNNPPPIREKRQTIAEKWAEEEKAQREARLSELSEELRGLSLEQLQKRALRENIGVARLMAALQQESWGADVRTPKQAMIAMLLEAEEIKLDAPIVSSYRGVWWSRNSHQWQAAIQYRGTKEMLGCFPTEELAAKAYDTVARREHGRNAQLNFPLPGERQGTKHRTWTEEDLRRRQESRLARKAEEAARAKKFERKLEKLRQKLLKLDAAVLKNKALREGLLPQRVEAAASATDGTQGDGAAKEALAQLLLNLERKREEERIADRRALELMEAAEQRRLKAGEKTEIIVKYTEDAPPEEDTKWRLMPSDVAGARRREIAALSQDDEVERKRAVAALQARQRKEEQAERERIERSRRARRAGLPLSDRRSLHRDESEMRALLEPKALKTAGADHFARIKRLLALFEHFALTKPALIALAKEVLMARGVLPKPAPPKMEQEVIDEWVQCEEPECRKWRLLPKNLKASELNIAVFTCARNFWNPAEASCSVPQKGTDRDDASADVASQPNPSVSVNATASASDSATKSRSREDDDADTLRLQKRRKLAVGDRRRLEQDEAKMRALLDAGANGEISDGHMGNFAMCRRWIEAKADLVDQSLLQEMRDYHASIERAKASAEAHATYKRLKTEALALKHAGRREEAKAKLREMNKLKPLLTN